jgi:hypothetical protein
LKNRKRYLLVIPFIAAMLFLFTRYNDRSHVNTGKEGADPSGDVRFNRSASRIIYTKHARCRMACRHIDDSEVKEILRKGRINYDKSEPAARPDPRFALEGRTRDDQEVRVIFAPADKGMVVITVIDLGKEWRCDCK